MNNSEPKYKKGDIVWVKVYEHVIAYFEHENNHEIKKNKLIYMGLAIITENPSLRTFFSLKNFSCTAYTINSLALISKYEAFSVCKKSILYKINPPNRLTNTPSCAIM